jgi:hypothetical protein
MLILLKIKNVEPLPPVIMELDVIHGLLKVLLIEVSKSKIINLVNLNLITNFLSVKPVVLLITEVSMPPNKKTVSMLVLILGV